MNYFLGTYEPTLLPNFQLAIPSKIRRAIAGNTLILGAGFDACIFGYDVSAFEKIVQPGLNKEISTSEGRDVRRKLFSSAEEVKTDSQGRLALPQHLRDYAGIGIGDELIVLGAGDHFEIWKKEEYDRLGKTIHHGQ